MKKMMILPVMVLGRQRLDLWRDRGRGGRRSGA